MHHALMPHYIEQKHYHQHSYEYFVEAAPLTEAEPIKEVIEYD
jgi:hypothetical protein